MNRWRRKFLPHFLVILALITAGISPACKFISGQTSFTEICTTDGIKLVEVPAEEGQADTHHASAEQCAFCFTSSHVKVTGHAPESVIVPPVVTAVLLQSATADIIPQPSFNDHAPRGPPVFL